MKGHYSTGLSNAAAADYEIPLKTVTTPAGSLEVKDNMAYGQVISGQTNRSTATTPPVYETVHS